MNLRLVVALAAFAVPVIACGHTPDGLAAAAAAAAAATEPTVRAAQSLTIGDLRVRRRAPAGRVRGSVAVGPAGAALEVVVRQGGRRVGHGTLAAAAGPRTSFSVRLNSASRARLRRAGHLDLQIEVTASAPGSRVSTGASAHVTR
jgi:hypothetical protein